MGGLEPAAWAGIAGSFDILGIGNSEGSWSRDLKQHHSDSLRHLQST
jgi:hypothetical protein